MTRYTVEWDPDVQADFIDRWVEADSPTRSIFTAAANWVDRELVVDPETKGKYRPDVDARIVDVPVEGNVLVAVTFHVHPEDRLVRVVRFLFLRRGALG